MGPMDADDVDLYGRLPFLLSSAPVARRLDQDHKLTNPALLGIDKSASQADIKKAYRKVGDNCALIGPAC